MCVCVRVCVRARVCVCVCVCGYRKASYNPIVENVQRDPSTAWYVKRIIVN